MSLASLFKWGRKTAEPTAAEKPAASSGAGSFFGKNDAGPRSLAESGKYAVQLKRGGSAFADAASLVEAWKALEEQMALVPAGEVTRRAETPASEPAPYVSALYIDRFTVTNRQYAAFVADGGYDQAELWPEEVWPNVAQFVDTSGFPGPRYWQQGRPQKKQDNHPVTGVCWYEANAYALWSGKRLPSSIEWERSGTWPTNLDDQSSCVRYPWGNAFDPHRANTWSSGHRTTVPVDTFPDGCTPNGVYQLVGNVWEWVADEYFGPAVREGLRVSLDQLMAEIRGGAFDTYFDVQVTCRFRTGQPLLYRGANVGFRCVVPAEELRRPAEVDAFA